MKLPKTVLNRLTNKLGIANIMSQSTTNNVISPTIKLIFLFIELLKNAISYIYIPLLKKFNAYKIVVRAKLLIWFFAPLFLKAEKVELDAS